MIEVEQDGPIWTLTLARPDKANALTGEMLSDLADAVGGRSGRIPDEAIALIRAHPGRGRRKDRRQETGRSPGPP